MRNDKYEEITGVKSAESEKIDEFMLSGESSEMGQNKKLILRIRYWEAELLYGRYCESTHKMYAIRVTSKLGDKESHTFLYNDLQDTNKREKVIQILESFGELEETDIGHIYEYARELKINNLYVEVNLDEELAEFVDENNKYISRIIDYVEEHQEELVTKSSDSFKESEHKGVWLDTKYYKNKYGEIVLAIPNEIVQDILVCSNTKMYSAIREGLIRKGILIGETGEKNPVKDITLATRIEKKCCLFRINNIKQLGDLANE